MQERERQMYEAQIVGTRPRPFARRREADLGGDPIEERENGAAEGGGGAAASLLARAFTARAHALFTRAARERESYRRMRRGPCRARSFRALDAYRAPPPTNL